MPTVRAGDLPYTGVNSEVPSPQVPSTYQSIRAAPEDFGAGIGTALSQLGSTIERGAGQFAENAIARQQLENQVRADDQTNKYQETVTKILHGDPDTPGDTGFFGKRGEDAMRAFPQVSKDINDLRNTMRSQLANDRQRLSFDNESRRYAALASSRMGEHYDREFKNYGTAVNKAGAENAMAGAATALANGDQAEFERQLGENMKFKLKQAELAGTAGNAEVVNSILASTREDAVKMKFLKLSETNPYAAKQFLDANTDALKPGEAHSLFKTIEPQWRKIQAAIDNKEMEAPQGWNEPPRGTYDPGHVDTTGTGVGHVAPKAERLAYYKQKTAELGLNYKAIVATVANEGLHNYIGDNGKSFGDFQLYTGGGMGNEAEAAGVNIRDPKAWKQQADYALQQMAMHKGDAEWFNSQWHGPHERAPWAAHQFGQPDSAPVAAASARQSPLKIDYAFGDSNGQLATNHGVPGEVGIDVVVGENPEEIYGRVQARGKEFFAGKTPILASGSNDPTQVEFIEKSAAFLKDAGVKGMVIPGVGPGVPGGQAAADVLNAQLQGIAQKYGGTFVMPDNWQKDGYHIANVPKFLEKANAALGAGTPPAVAPAEAPAPTVTGRGAPLTPAQLREGTSGSSAAAEIILADAGGTDTIEKKAPIPGMKLAPIPPPDPDEPPDASVPGLTEKIADLASQPWAKENPTRLLDAIKYARTQANARWTDSQRQLRLQNEQTKATSEATQDQYMKKLSNGEEISVRQIEGDSRMTPEHRREMVRFVERENKQDPASLVSKRNTVTLLNGIWSGKITEETPLKEAYLQGNVTYQDFEKTRREFRDQRNEGGEQMKDEKKHLMDAVTNRILGPYAVDREGEAMDEVAASKEGRPSAKMRVYNFIADMNTKIGAYEKAGKNPRDLFKPDTPDFLGSPKNLHRFEPTVKQKIDAGKKNAPKPVSEMTNQELIDFAARTSNDADYAPALEEAVKRGLAPKPAPPPIPGPLAPQAPIAR